METELELFRGRFTTIQTGLRGEVDRGIKLMEELLTRLDSTKLELHQTKLDLESESQTRRRLQQEKKEWKAREERRPFVAALIDADADVYMFDEELLKKGEKGGVEAADALLAAVQRYAKETLGFSAETNIVVKAFANMTGLREALQRRGTPCDIGQLRAFASGFNNRQALFDFVDVGSGKERADSKIRENISFFVDSFQCKHLMLACGHDTGYAPFLGQFVATKQIADRITLIKGRCQLPPEIQKLGLKTTQFDGVFKGLAPIATRTVWGRNTAAALKPAAHLAQDEHSNDVQPGISKTPSGYANPAAQSSRLGPVIRDQNGRRVDKALQVDQTAVERLRKGGLCYWLYLRGECVAQCGRNHVHRPLEDEEFDALWWLARHARCFANRKADRSGINDCRDAKSKKKKKPIMPEYWISDAVRNRNRTILTKEQREEISFHWRTSLQEFLLEQLAQIAHADHIDYMERDSAIELMLVVEDIAETAHKADIREIFEQFGSVARMWFPHGPGDRPVHGQMNGYSYEGRSMSVRFAMWMDVDWLKPDAGFPVKYPTAHELLVRSPALRASVAMQEIAEDATYATVVLTTSWPLDDKWKAELETLKNWAPGDEEGSRVQLAYATSYEEEEEEQSTPTTPDPRTPEPEPSAPRPLPALTFDQRERLAAHWVDDLQPDLLYWLSHFANLDVARPPPPKPANHRLTTLHVTNVSLLQPAAVRELFAAFGPLTHFSMPADSERGGAPHGYAYVAFADWAAAVAACRGLDGHGDGHVLMRVAFVHELAGLLVEYGFGDGGGLVVREPALRATVELRGVSTAATYATVVVATSWELSEERRRGLEEAKRWVLGEELNDRIVLAYETCAPPSQ
ncbi:hypothetical protein PG997_002062 [Apiospora hydei]|uniref:RRM domain-containing protein n=1 Tax=Apiospora hydei TaxID=1337664 RepID=A0ABR1X8A3_9PEZI